MRLALPSVAILLLAGRASAGVEVHGVAAARGIAVEGQPSWIDGGFGRLTEGASAADDSRLTVRGRAHLGLDWTPAGTWLVHAHGLLQGEPDSSGGSRAGLVEAFVQWRPEPSPHTALRLRAGLFFPQTSLEAVDRLWQSPYALTLSALSSWIGEEVRMAGLETMLVLRGDRDRLEVGGAAFGADDASGALLAWRGFALGDRLATLTEVLPLPPLGSLGPLGAFKDQRDDGTRPLDELDGRVGWHARARFTREGAFRLQGAYTDNRGDRALHRGQYAWQTRWAQAGLEATLGPVVLVAEGAAGDTGMGPAVPNGPFVDLRFRTAYALVSGKAGAVRITGRAEAWDNDDRDGTAEPDEEHGWSATAAVLWQAGAHVRVGVEGALVRAQRPAAAFSGADPDTDAGRVQVELRFVF